MVVYFLKYLFASRRNFHPFLAGVILFLAAIFGTKGNAAENPPLNGFQASYFDRTIRNGPKITEVVPNIAIKFGSRGGPGHIAPAQFAASWVGRLSFDAPVTKEILVSLSWSKVRIRIDGDIVYEGTNSRRFTHAFSAGEHLVEVFYINNWHTVEFKVTFQDPVKTYSDSELFARLKLLDPQADEIVYVGLYESDTPDTGVSVQLADKGPDSGKGQLLWLDSYEAIDWTVAGGQGLRAVIVASYAPGSRVLNLSANIPVLYAEKGIGVHSKLQVKCRCVGTAFRCNNKKGPGALAETMMARTGARVVAYGAAYSAGSVNPEPFDDVVRMALERQKEEVARAKDRCSKRINPDFDTLFDNN
ncbi:hypothetical protein [uncultured Roseibium sp.]|uniref:hypothetical protein n=1 Tax=uncultured Roseibium sp. TaxID=1936171 RepID=UPI0032173F57